MESWRTSTARLRSATCGGTEDDAEEIASTAESTQVWSAAERTPEPPRIAGSVSARAPLEPTAPSPAYHRWSTSSAAVARAMQADYRQHCLCFLLSYWQTQSQDQQLEQLEREKVDDAGEKLGTPIPTDNEVRAKEGRRWSIKRKPPFSATNSLCSHLRVLVAQNWIPGEVISPSSTKLTVTKGPRKCLFFRFHRTQISRTTSL